MVCDCGLGDLGQDFQEQKRSSPALVPLEIPSKPWPCAFLMLPALSGGSRPPQPQDVHLNRG